MTALIVGIFIGIIGATIYYDRKLLQELKSYRKHFQSHSQFYDWTYLNPDDFGVNDRFNIIRDVVKERGLKEW